MENNVDIPDSDNIFWITTSITSSYHSKRNAINSSHLDDQDCNMV